MILNKGYKYTPGMKGCVPMVHNIQRFDGKEYWETLWERSRSGHDPDLQEILDRMDREATKRLYKSLFIGQTIDVRGASK